MATKGLHQDEIAKVNDAMQLESRRIAVEKDEIINARYVSKDSQIAFKSKPVDK